MSETTKPDEQDRRAESGAYQAPPIEQTVTADDLEREVHYAAVFSA